MAPDAYAPIAAAKVRLGSRPAIQAGGCRAAGPSMAPDAYAPIAEAKVRLGRKPAIQAGGFHPSGLIGCENINHFHPPTRRQQA